MRYKGEGVMGATDERMGGWRDKGKKGEGMRGEIRVMEGWMRVYDDG